MSIMYTPMPIELILEGMEKERPPYQELEVGGAKLLVEQLGMHNYRVVRLISTDPMDYLKSEFQPGTELQFEPQSALKGIQCPS